ncbi:MAG: hypothetical protein LBQ10_01275 [Desulfovibrio sp.]|jgi:hypothetical protein|nr:hypothetical protein [Desulfovibrio sp.]
MFGDGEVVETAANEHILYPVGVRFERTGEFYTFTQDGKNVVRHASPTLFHAGSHIVAAPEPERKPKEYQFKPFDKVLVRESTDAVWRVNFYSHKHSDAYLHQCIYSPWRYCIPYEGNEHLAGTTDAPEGQ